jgi:hypothetical protein
MQDYFSRPLSLITRRRSVGQSVTARVQVVL